MDGWAEREAGAAAAEVVAASGGIQAGGRRGREEKKSEAAEAHCTRISFCAGAWWPVNEEQLLALRAQMALAVFLTATPRAGCRPSA
ncbi:unnamed protein product [Closterium sp. NIES-64]|nr:unnamed protein product [Closterium sp. NIES-64]